MEKKKETYQVRISRLGIPVGKVTMLHISGPTAGPCQCGPDITQVEGVDLGAFVLLPHPTAGAFLVAHRVISRGRKTSPWASDVQVHQDLKLREALPEEEELVLLLVEAYRNGFHEGRREGFFAALRKK